MSEKEKFIQWLDAEKKRGLIDIKLVYNDSFDFVKDFDEEDFFKELNWIVTLAEHR
jgi:hypothetical protein